MRFMKPGSARRFAVYGLLLAIVALLGLTPWSIVATKAVTAEETSAQATTVRGKFLSFKEGVLKIKAIDERRNETQELQWTLADDTKVVSHIPDGIAQDGTAKNAFKLWEAGAVIAVKLNKGGQVALVEIGITKKGDKTPEKPAAKAEQADKTVRGKFVSMKDRTLTIQDNSGALVETKVFQNTKILQWSDEKASYQPADSAQVLEQAKAGMWCIVNVAKENVTIRIGARKGRTAGTFVSYRDDRLLMLGKDLGESFTKKYGNNLHFQKFRDDVPAYESVDGGEYKLIGTANKVLGDVKEGTIVTVHAEGDDNITLIQIGVPKSK